jgi:hypothetical protein
MQMLTRRRVKLFAIIALAIGMSTMSIGCTVTGGQIGGSVGRGTNGQPTGSIGGTITFKSSLNNQSEVVDGDTGQVYTDDGSLDYSHVSGTEGDTFGGGVDTYYGGGDGGGGGGGCGGGGYACLEEYQY